MAFLLVGVASEIPAINFRFDAAWSQQKLAEIIFGGRGPKPAMSPFQIESNDPGRASAIALDMWAALVDSMAIGFKHTSSSCT